MSATITPIGDWNREINDGCLAVGKSAMVSMRKSGAEITRWGLILMMQSARKLTGKAPKNRKIERGAKGGSYIVTYHKSGPRKNYLPSKTREPDKHMEMVAKLKPIRLAGLAKASWGWGMQKLFSPANTAGFSDKRNVVKAGPVVEGGTRGHEVENKLSYVLEAMPAGWEASVKQSAMNKMYHRMKTQLQNDFNRAARTGRTLTAGLLRA